jgi:uncharacterized membrane protein (DUF485 family)
MSKKEIEEKEREELESYNPVEIRRILMNCANQIQKSLIKGEEIEKVINRPFVIKLNDIINLYHIIIQRLDNDEEKIEFQNFSISVSSSGNNFHRFNSIEKFEKNIETRQIVPNTIQMTWNVIIKFTQQEPLKQTINVDFTKPDYENTDNNYDNDNVFMLVYKGKPIIGNGAIIISIETTNKIWALDVMSHIRDWIEKNVEKPSINEKYKKIYKRRNKIRTTIKTILQLIPYLLFILIGYRIFYSELFKTIPINQSISILIISIGVILIYNFLITKYAGYFSKVLSKRFNSLMPKSFFVLSESDEKEYEQYLRNIGVGAKKIIYNILGSIIVNVIASAIVLVVWETVIK